MRLLLVEDDALKSDRIIDFLRREYPNADIDIQRSYQSGLKAAERAQFDLLILDMTLPTFDVGPRIREGRSRTMGGRELMRKLKLKGIPLKAVVVTQFSTFGEGPSAINFDTLMEECEAELSGVFCGGVSYKASSSIWMSELKALIHSALESK